MNKNEEILKNFGISGIRTHGPPNLVILRSKFKSEMLENLALWVVFIQIGALVLIGKNRMNLNSIQHLDKKGAS